MSTVIAGGATAAAVLALALQGGQAPAGKSGGRPAAELDLAVHGYPGEPSAELAERFARRVQMDGGGTLAVSIVYLPDRDDGAAGTAPPMSAVRAVTAGGVELGIVPTWTLADRGVTTLRPLQAPFRITTYGHAVRATSGILAERLQAGLAEVGLTGLALVPEGMERPFGYLKPLLTPADFAGLRIAVDRSRATGRLIRALGARPSVRASGSVLDTAVRPGFAPDTGPAATPKDTFPASAYTATNIALFPRVDAIVVSNRALSRLTAHERAVLHRAAVEARSATVAAAGEPRQAAVFCANGGTLVDAPASALSALQAKAAPVLASLRRNPATRDLIAAIDDVRPRKASDPPPCAPGAPVHAPLQEESYDFRTWTSLQPPAGSYRRVLSAAAIRRAGADSAEARRNAGVTTLTFSGPRAARRFALEWRGAGVRPPCRGRVGLNARHIVLEWNPATPCHGFMVLSALTDGLGDLHVTVDRRSQPAWIRTAFAGTWRRVDCRPSVAPAVPAAKREQWRVGALHIRRAELPAVEGRIRAAQLLGVPGAAELADARGERVRLLRLAALLERNAKYIPLLGAPPPSDRERPC